MKIRHLAALGCLLMSTLGFTQAPTATYRFESNLADSQAALPDLTPVDPLLLNTFATDQVFGATRTVYQCNGSLGAGGNAGLQIDLRPYFSSEFSIEFVAAFDNVQGWSKLIDNQGLAYDTGFYTYLSQLYFYPLGNGIDLIDPNTYYHVVLTQDQWDNVTVYLNGKEQLTVNSSGMNLTDITSLFMDDASTAFNEYTTAKIALLRLYNYPLNPGEAALAASDPFGDGYFVSPEAYWVTSGFELAGDLTSLYWTEDNSLVIFPDEGTFVGEVVMSATAPVWNPSALRFSIETSVGRPLLAQAISLYNYDSGSWSAFDGRLAPTQDALVSKLVTGDPGRFVSDAGEMLARVTWLVINDEDPSQDGWPQSIDVVRWTVAP